jgi:hypothetical protein
LIHVIEQQRWVNLQVIILLKRLLFINYYTKYVNTLSLLIFPLK